MACRTRDSVLPPARHSIGIRQKTKHEALICAISHGMAISQACGRISISTSQISCVVSGANAMNSFATPTITLSSTIGSTSLTRLICRGAEISKGVTMRQAHVIRTRI